MNADHNAELVSSIIVDEFAAVFHGYEAKGVTRRQSIRKALQHVAPMIVARAIAKGEK